MTTTSNVAVEQRAAFRIGLDLDQLLHANPALAPFILEALRHEGTVDRLATSEDGVGKPTPPDKRAENLLAMAQQRQRSHESSERFDAVRRQQKTCRITGQYDESTVLRDVSWMLDQHLPASHPGRLPLSTTGYAALVRAWLALPTDDHVERATRMLTGLGVTPAVVEEEPAPRRGRRR